MKKLSEFSSEELSGLDGIAVKFILPGPLAFRGRVIGSEAGNGQSLPIFIYAIIENNISDIPIEIKQRKITINEIVSKIEKTKRTGEQEVKFIFTDNIKVICDNE